MQVLSRFLAVALTASLGAQSPLTTTFASNNGGGAGGQVMFDLNVTTTVTIQGLDVSLGQVVGFAGTIQVFQLNPTITPVTYVGHDLTAADWTQVSSGPVIAQGLNQPCPVCLTPPIVLAPGDYSFAIRYTTVSARYTNGNGTTVPGSGTNQTYANAHMTLRAGLAQNVAFTSPSIALPRVWNGNIHYLLGAQATACASNVSSGAGCYRRQGSFYELFTTPTSASTALQGQTLTWIYSPTGYTMVWGLPTAFVPPSGTATNPVAAGDATSGTVNLGAPLTIPDNVPGSTTNTLWIHVNGFVGTGDVLPTFKINANFPVVQPTISAIDALLNASNTTWYCWHDMNTAEAGSGQIKFEVLSNVAYITFQDVELAPTTVVNRATFQYQFDLNTNNVTLVVQTIPTAGGALTSDNWLVGYSGAGASYDPGPSTLSLISGLQLHPIENGLTLAASPRPAIGATVDVVTSKLPIGSVVGILFLGLNPIPGGIDLGIIGAAGCSAYIDPTTAVSSTLIAPSLTVPLPIPPVQALYGTVVHGQSVMLAPGENPFGLVTSNAVAMTIGSF
ncbi:MAG TPA: hypothetical protein VF384_16670 [Planctomycetota bacterium]